MYDIIIVGSGPAGLSAAIYGVRENRKVLVIEKEFEGTGQIAESLRVDNYPGLLGISGYELGEKFREHTAVLGVEFKNSNVVHIEQVFDEPKEEKVNNAYWRVESEDGGVEEAFTIIYSAGATARKLQIQGETQFLGNGVSFCAVCDGAFYKNKVVAVIGGGDTALDDVLYLSKLCKTVYLIHRRDTFRGSRQSMKQIEACNNVRIIVNAEVLSINGNGRVEELELKDGQKIAVDGVFVAIGSIPNSALAKPYVESDEKGYLIADENGITRTEGFYVAGDVRAKQLRQVVTAVADGANAATAAGRYLQKIADGNKQIK